MLGNTLRLASAVVALGSASAPAQQSVDGTFTVGTAVAARGVTAMGAIEVPPRADSGLSIPVAVINGARPGPVVALVAGSHPTEYSTVIGLQHLIPRIDPARLTGTVIVVPVLNVPAFVEMTPQVNPPDPRNMVGGYPGDSTGTRSQRAEALLTSQVIRQADVLVDFHGGDFDEDVGIPFSGWIRGGQRAQDSAAERLVLAFGLDHIVVFDRDAGSPNAGRSLAGQALVRGKTTFLVAVGRSGVVAPQDLTTITDGSLNILSTLKMLDRATHLVEHPVWLHAVPPVQAERAGVFFAAIRPGIEVAKGAVLGYTTDFLGRKTGNVLSPVGGLVTLIHGVPSMWPGATLAEVYPVWPELPPWQAPRPQ